LELLFYIKFYVALVSLVKQERGLGFFWCLKQVSSPLGGALLPGREGD
jgi:hypothetical protein